MKPNVVSIADLGLTDADTAQRAQLKQQYVPQIQGNCEMIEGGSPAELADNLMARLRAESLLS